MKLETLTQKNNKAYRKNRHHQFLTTDIGIPQLDHYISKLLGVMVLSKNDKDFDKNFNLAFHEEIELKNKEKELKNLQLELYPDKK